MRGEDGSSCTEAGRYDTLKKLHVLFTFFFFFFAVDRAFFWYIRGTQETHAVIFFFGYFMQGMIDELGRQT